MKILITCWIIQITIPRHRRHWHAFIPRIAHGYMYILLGQRHHSWIIEWCFRASERLLLLLLLLGWNRLLGLIFDWYSYMFRSRFIRRIVSHRHFRRLCWRVILHNVDLHRIGTNVGRFFHQCTRIVIFYFDYRLSEMIVSMLYRVKRLLMTATLLILLLQRFNFMARFVALIVHTSEN